MKSPISKSKCAPNIFAGKGRAVEHAITENYIGEFGVCIEDAPAPARSVMIAGPYQGGNPRYARKHVKFACVGMPALLMQETPRSGAVAARQQSTMRKPAGIESAIWIIPVLIGANAQNGRASLFYVPVPG